MRRSPAPPHVCTGHPLLGLKLPVSFRMSGWQMRTRHPKSSLPCLLACLHHTFFTLALSCRTGPAAPSLRNAPIEGTMNGFTEHGLDEDAFGATKGGIASFDAFREFSALLLVAGSCTS